MRRQSPLAGLPGRLLLLAGLCAILPIFASTHLRAAPATPADLKKVHILLVFDTDSDLEESLKIDEWRMKMLLFKSIPEARRTLTILKGKEATRDKILETYARLKVTKDEGLFFFYGGHGATDDRQGHYIKLRNSKPLLRTDLRKAMEAKNAGLVVLLTDCCSTRITLRPMPVTKGGIGLATTIHPTFRNLFFQARGVVDITAATDSASWCDDEYGGIFTRSLARMLSQPVKELDTNGDGLVAWEEFFPLLQEDTEQTFSSWSRKMRERGESIKDTAQTPKAFALPRQGQPEGKQAVVSLENTSEKPLRFRVSWGTDGTWSEWTPIDARGRAVVSTQVARGAADAPTLKIEFEGRKGGGQVRSRLWAGTGKPAFGDGELTRIRFNR